VRAQAYKACTHNTHVLTNMCACANTATHEHMHIHTPKRMHLGEGGDGPGACEALFHDRHGACTCTQVHAHVRMLPQIFISLWRTTQAEGAAAPGAH